MEEEDTKTCDNCKRDIPGSNYTIHQVHCTRNIKVCPVCKEPVLQAELAEHHDKLHKLLPCKQCGESVCGTDLEDHVRDSCGHTVKACRYCTLEVPRRDLPTHESYCGARTERCAECNELVMIKYRQIHVDSNHGFLRLDDEPAPRPPAATSTPAHSPPHPNANVDRPQTSNSCLNGVQPGASISGIGSSNSPPSLLTLSAIPGPSMIKNEFPSLFDTSSRPPAKRDNNQPQINTNVQATEKIKKDLSLSRGAVKKRPAPKPPAPIREPPNLDPRREMPYQSALRRTQEEERQRQEQSERNLAAGLPPVLSAAAKLEKLRKMDALHNRETDNVDYRNKLTGRVWMPPDVPIGHILDTEPTQNDTSLFAERRKINRNTDKNGVNFTGSDESRINVRNENELRNCQNGAGNCQNGAGRCQNGAGSCQNRAGNGDDVRNYGNGDCRRAKKVIDKNDLRDVTPMSTEQFLTRFSELTVGPDRFTDIKSQLTRLRRGLSEVTAPYNSNTTNNQREDPPPRRFGRLSPADDECDDDDGAVRLPCEFCGVLIIADELVQHETGCRPDLARLTPAPAPAAPPPPAHTEDPVIPCEFCARSLPIYLITEHQERCGRDRNLLYAD